MNNQMRTLFYGVIGGYLVYLAYDLLPGRNAMEGSNATWMMVCCVVFAVAGVVFLALAVRLFKKVFIDKDENYLEREPEAVEDAEEATEVIDEAAAEVPAISEEAEDTEAPKISEEAEEDTEE
ncbi:MAG: hypothetical protein IKY23_02835 [Lachnospiraceae bacterium]|nr:hypothetical protein [Lachnospiraceae bacterium]